MAHQVDPARVDLAGGKVETRVDLDAQGVLNGDLDLTLRNVRLNKLLAAFKVDVGAIQMEKRPVRSAPGKLTIQAQSIRDMAPADGELADHGAAVNPLIIEALADVGEISAVLAAGGEGNRDMVPVQCRSAGSRSRTAS
jgi:hypothetical protein